MMRERANVAGGSFRLHSELGRGTTVTAHFPQVWVDESSEGDWTEPADGVETTEPADGVDTVASNGGGPAPAEQIRVAETPAPQPQPHPLRQEPGQDPRRSASA